MVRQFILKTFYVTFFGLLFSINTIGAQHITINSNPRSENSFKQVIANESGRYAAALDNDHGAIGIIDLFSAIQIWRYQETDFIRNLYFLNDSHLILFSSSKIQILDIVKHRITATYNSPYYIQYSDFAYQPKTLALYSQNNVILLHCQNDALNQIATHIYKDIEQFQISEDGKHLAYYHHKKISVVTLPDFKVQKSIKAENIESFDLGNDYLVFIYSSPFSYRMFDLNGTTISQTIGFHSFLKTNVSTVTAMDFGFLLQGYKSLVFVGKTGQQTIIKTNDYFYGAQIIKNIGKTLLWNPNGFSLIDIEGNTFTQFPVSQLNPTEIIYNTYSSKFIYLSDTQISFGKSQIPGAPTTTHGVGYCKAFSISKFILLGFTDGTLQIWDTETEKRIASQSLAFSPTAVSFDSITGSLYFNNYNDNSIYSWDYINHTVTVVFQDKFPVTALSAHDNTLYIGNTHGDVSIVNGNAFVHRFNTLLYGGISCLAQLDSGVMAGSYGRFVILPDNLADSAKMELYTGHNGFISSFCSNKNQTLFFTCSDDNTIKLWERKNQRLLESYNLDSISAKRMQLENEGNLHFQGFNFTSGTLTDSFFQLSERLKKGEIVVQSPNNNKPLKLAINPDGNLLATVDENTVKIRDLKSGFLISECKTDNNTVNGIAFAKDGNLLVVASGSNVQCFDALTGQSIRTIDLSKSGHPGYLGGTPAFLGRSIHDVECINNGIIAMNHFGWHNPILLHKNSGLKLGEIYINPGDDIDEQLMDLKFTPDEKFFITMGSHFVKAFSYRNRIELLWSIPREGVGKTNRQYLDFMNISPDGKYLLFVDFDPYFKIKTVDIQSGKILQINNGGIGAFAKGGTYVYTKGKKYLAWRNVLDSTYRVLDVEFDAEINNIIYNDRSDIFAISDIFGNIKILEGRSGNQIFEISRWKQYTYNSVLNHSGKFMLFNNRYGLFTINMNNLKRQAINANNYPLSGAFSPNSDVIYYRKNDTFYSQNLLSGNTQFLFAGGFKSNDFVSLAVSSDGQILYYRTANDSIHLYHIKNRKFLFHFHAFTLGKIDGIVLRDVVPYNQSYYLQGIGINTYGNKSGMQHMLISTDGKFSSLSLSKEIVYTRSSEDGFDELRFRRDTKVFGLSPSKKYTSFMHDYRLLIVDNTNGDTIFSRDNPILNQINTAIFNQNEQWFIIGFDDGHIEIFDLIHNRSAHNNKGEYSGLNLLKSVAINSMGIEHIQLAENKLLVKGQNPFISILNPKDDFKKQLDMDFIEKEDQIYINPEGYYYSTKAALNFIGYKRDISIYPFEQVDLIYNRPDKVLISAECEDSALIKSFHSAYLKRLKKYSNQPQNSPDFSNPPTANITNIANIPLDDTSEYLDIKVHAESASSPLKSMNVWINGVPSYGARGKKISQTHRTKMDTTIRIRLSQGRNEIKMSVTDMAGIESFKTPILVNHTHSAFASGKVYFFGFGIEKFKDSAYNLKYSVKDIQDLEKSLRLRYGDTLISNVYLNEAVTQENIGKAKNILRQSSIHDKVIVAFSGHGLLSEAYDYYLSSYNTDFNKPEKNGISYELFENLLDSIPARQKLLLIDACHSGEVDKEEAVYIQAMADSLGLSKGSKIRNTAPRTAHLGLSNSFELMQELFVNVGKGTGAIVISASAGSQFALERGDLKNGVFTYTILEAMESHNTITVSELKTIIGKRVVELTNGMQKPTSRNETIYNDWRVW